MTIFPGCPDVTLACLSSCRLPALPFFCDCCLFLFILFLRLFFFLFHGMDVARGERVQTIVHPIQSTLTAVENHVFLSIREMLLLFTSYSLNGDQNIPSGTGQECHFYISNIVKCSRCGKPHCLLPPPLFLVLEWWNGIQMVFCREMGRLQQPNVKGKLICIITVNLPNSAQWRCTSVRHVSL